MGSRRSSERVGTYIPPPKSSVTHDEEGFLHTDHAAQARKRAQSGAESLSGHGIVLLNENENPATTGTRISDPRRALAAVMVPRDSVELEPIRGTETVGRSRAQAMSQSLKSVVFDAAAMMRQAKVIKEIMMRETGLDKLNKQLAGPSVVGQGGPPTTVDKDIDRRNPLRRNPVTEQDKQDLSELYSEMEENARKEAARRAVGATAPVNYPMSSSEKNERHDYEPTAPLIPKRQKKSFADYLKIPRVGTLYARFQEWIEKVRIRKF